jgi:hypothetical protein
MAAAKGSDIIKAMAAAWRIETSPAEPQYPAIL